ncbi:MAG: hypothetical protein ACJ76P_04400 [Actinomycetota bacterium]
MAGDGILFAVVIGTLLGVLRFTSPAVRELSYRKGQLWYLGPSTKRYPTADEWRSHPSAAVSARDLWIWTGAAVVLIASAVATWTIGSILVSVVLIVIALCLLGMAIGGYRTNRYLRHQERDPVADVVDRGLLRFSPKTDDLIRQICAAGGRGRLEDFPWGDPEIHGNLPELHRRLEAVLNSVKRT